MTMSAPSIPTRMLGSGPSRRKPRSDDPPDDLDAWLADMVLAVTNPPPLALHQRQAAEEMKQMVRELLADPRVPWPSDLPGPQWR